MKVLILKGENYTEIESADSVKIILEDIGEEHHYTLNDEGIVGDTIINGEIDKTFSCTYNELEPKDNYIFNGPSAYAMPFENNVSYYDCYLTSFSNKLETAKLIREVFGSNLSDTFGYLTKLPVLIGSSLSKEMAKELLAKFISIGCEVEMKKVKT